MPTPDTQTLSERVTVLETLADAGSPALRKVDEKVEELRDEIRNHSEALNKQEEQLTILREDLNHISACHRQLVNTAKSIRTVVITFGTAAVFFLGAEFDWTKLLKILPGLL